MEYGKCYNSFLSIITLPTLLVCSKRFLLDKDEYRDRSNS